MIRRTVPILILIFFFIHVKFSFCRDWQELKGEHFIVYFAQDNLAAKDILQKAELYYQRIADNLGYARYSEFWIWDKRVKIYIYPVHEAFLKATGQPSWSEGMADYKKKQIISYLWSKGFVDALLPHEIAHLIFRDFVGFKGQVPLWLDEGVAQWAEETKRKEAAVIARQMFKNNGLFSLEDMMKLDILNIKDKDRVYVRSVPTKEGQKGVLFLSADNLVTTYYIQAVSLVQFLIDSYGSNSFSDFCRQLRDGKDLEEALKFAYPVYLRNLSDLEDKWRQSLEKQ